MEILLQNVSPLQLQSRWECDKSHSGSESNFWRCRVCPHFIEQSKFQAKPDFRPSNEVYPTGTKRQTARSVLLLAVMTHTSPARNMEGIVREFGVDMYTLLYLKWITNKDLLYSTGNSAQCYVAVWMEESLGESGYMYMYGWVLLLSTWGCDNTVNWLYSSIQ